MCALCLCGRRANEAPLPDLPRVLVTLCVRVLINRVLNDIMSLKQSEDRGALTPLLLNFQIFASSLMFKGMNKRESVCTGLQSAMLVLY